MYLHLRDNVFSKFIKTMFMVICCAVSTSIIISRIVAIFVFKPKCANNCLTKCNNENLLD